MPVAYLFDDSQLASVGLQLFLLPSNDLIIILSSLHEALFNWSSSYRFLIERAVVEIGWIFLCFYFLLVARAQLVRECSI